MRSFVNEKLANMVEWNLAEKYKRIKEVQGISKRKTRNELIKT